MNNDPGIIEYPLSTNLQAVQKLVSAARILVDVRVLTNYVAGERVLAIMCKNEANEQ